MLRKEEFHIPQAPEGIVTTSVKGHEEIEKKRRRLWASWRTPAQFPPAGHSTSCVVGVGGISLILTEEGSCPRLLSTEGEGPGLELVLWP